MFKTNSIRGPGSRGYATAANFLEIYNEEMHSLLLLSLLLTADPEKAEQCFIGALEECLHGMDVFMEWARYFARRAIIKQAVKVVALRSRPDESLAVTGARWNRRLLHENFIGAIFALATFDRFAFVLSLLERQSDVDCCVMLSCKRREFVSARAQALRSLSEIKMSCNPFKEALLAWEMIRALGKPCPSAS